MYSSLKLSLLASAVHLILAPVAVSDQLALPEVSATAGTRLVLPVVITSQDGSVTALQFDLEYDAAAMSVVATASEAARSSGKNLYSADLAPGKKRFLIAGLNQNPIPSGALINLLVSVNTNASEGAYRLAFSGVVGTNRFGQPEPIAGADGVVLAQGSLGPGVRLQTTGVVNGASLLPGPVAPGLVIRLVGSAIGPASVQQPAVSRSSTALAETAVLFDRTPAPLLSVALNQIDVIIPYGVAGKAVTEMQVTNGGQLIAGLVLPVAEAVPGIFTLDSSGVGQGAILNQDSTVNSLTNPASRGSVVALFATGAGQTDPPGTDGLIALLPLPKPITPISVKIDDIDAEVLYAGAAPNFVAGILLVTCRIPINTAPGQAVPVVMKAGTASSQPGVTLAVR